MPDDIPTRVAILEEIARATKDTLERLDRRIEALETNMRADMREMRAEQRRDYRWLLGIMLGGFASTIAGFASLLAVMAHGFHWI